MNSRIADRLDQLQQEQQHTQQALAALEQQRQGLLQALIGQQYAVEVLQGLLEEPTSPRINIDAVLANAMAEVTPVDGGMSRFAF